MKNDLGLDFKIRLGRGFKTDAERAAKDIRLLMGFLVHARLPAAQLAERLGIKVIHPHEIKGISDQELSELENSGSSRWSAVYLPLPHPHRDLVINNRSHSLERQEANLFHEIAHQICEHEPDDIVFVNGFPIREFSKDKEDQANFLGQALHIPRDAAFWALKEKIELEEIGKLFCASSQVVKLRLNISGANKIMARSQTRWGSR